MLNEVSVMEEAVVVKNVIVVLVVVVIEVPDKNTLILTVCSLFFLDVNARRASKIVRN